MKFSVSKTDLLLVLNAVSKVILKRNSIAILENVLLSHQTGNYTLTGSTQENTLTMPVAILLDSGDTFQPFCFNANVIAPFLATLPEQPLDFNVDFDKHEMTITYAGGKVSVPVWSADEYPKTEPIKDARVQFDIPTDVFLPAVKAASQCVGTSELRPVMTAIALDVNEEGVTFVGTDGHVLYKYVWQHGVPFLTVGTKDIILIPSAVVAALTAPFNGIDTVTITHDANHLTIENGDICFTIRDVEGRYPNYNSVIPEKQPYHILLPVKPLTAALRRVMLMASTSSELIRLSKEGNTITLSSQDIDYSRAATEQLQLAEGDNVCTLPDDYHIGLKSSHFLMLLSAISTDNVLLELDDPSRPMLLREDGNSTLTELVMPMLLESNE